MGQLKFTGQVLPETKLVGELFSEMQAQSQPVAIVVACNTATEVAIDAMRAALPTVPIVGTVPAIKPAAAFSSVKRIAVVATQRAAEEPYLLRLAEQWAADCQLTRLGDGALLAP